MEPVPADVIAAAEAKLATDVTLHETEAKTAEDAVAQARAVLEQVQAVLREAQAQAEEHRSALPDLYRRRRERHQHLKEAEVLQREIDEGVQAQEVLHKRVDERIDDLQEAALNLRAAQAERIELLAELEALNVADGGVRRALEVRHLLTELDKLDAELKQAVVRADEAVAELVAFDAQLAEAIKKQQGEAEEARKAADHVLIDDPPAALEPKAQVLPDAGRR